MAEKIFLSNKIIRYVEVCLMARGKDKRSNGLGKIVNNDNYKKSGIKTDIMTIINKNINRERNIPRK